MSKEKQIEEMAKVIEITEQVARDAHCGYPSPRMYAKDLYWHGYRKQKEGEWKMKVYPITSCSVCGVLRSVEYQQGWNFCPNCGAKMKGGAE
jgi:hypothetical protein